MSNLAFDFRTPIPPGETVYAVYAEQDSPVRSLFEINYEMDAHPGRVLARPPFKVAAELRPKFREFLLVDADWPFGSSGSPVLWFRPGSETPLLVGFIGGCFERVEDATGKVIDEINVVKRPAGLAIPDPPVTPVLAAQRPPPSPVTLPVGSVYRGHVLVEGRRRAVFVDPTGGSWIEDPETGDFERIDEDRLRLIRDAEACDAEEVSGGGTHDGVD